MARQRRGTKHTGSTAEALKTAKAQSVETQDVEEKNQNGSPSKAGESIERNARETPTKSTANGHTAAIGGAVDGELSNHASDTTSDFADGDESDGHDEMRRRMVHGEAQEGEAEEGDEDDEEEEDIFVVLELADFKNHPVLDDYKSITIEGIDTAKPTLHIGEYSLHGQLEETVGTHYFYDTKNRTEDNEYRFAGQTTKKIKFTIAPPEDF